MASAPTARAPHQGEEFEVRNWEFICRSGRISLDLVPTLIARGLYDIELLSGPAAVTHWCEKAGIDPAPVEVSAREVTLLKELREAIHVLAAARAHGTPASADAVATLNAHAAAIAAPPSLAPDGRSRVHAGAPSAENLRARVAHDAIDLFSGELGDRIKECEQEQCTVLFVDTTRARSRRWCAMAPCGDKYNAQRYRDRRRDNAENSHADSAAVPVGAA